MSAPSRRRNPTITRGKKSERKRNKRQELQKDNVSPINGLAAISEKAEQDRKARLINNGTTDADITLLSEPSSLFNSETNKIRNITTKNETNLINIKAANFEFGIELKATITDRSRVTGKKPKILNGMPKELRKKKEEIKQASRKIDENIIEKTRKRRELEKRNAAIAHENKLLAIKKEEADRLAQIELEKKMKIEAARIAAIEREEADRLAQIELEKKMKIEAARIAAIEREEADRLAQIELEKKMKIEAARIAAIEREEADRLAQIELEKKMKIEAARIAAIEREEADRLAQIDLEIRKSKHCASKKKEGFW